MTIARYYIVSGSPLVAPRLLFTAGAPWIQVTIRGIDANKRALGWPLLTVQRGGGILDWKENCVYEIVFSDTPFDQRLLDSLGPAGQPVVIGNNLACSPSSRNIVKFDENPPPPPPPGEQPTAPFDTGNVFRIY